MIWWNYMALGRFVLWNTSKKSQNLQLYVLLFQSLVVWHKIFTSIWWNKKRWDKGLVYPSYWKYFDLSFMLQRLFSHAVQWKNKCYRWRNAGPFWYFYFRLRLVFAIDKNHTAVINICNCDLVLLSFNKFHHRQWKLNLFLCVSLQH